MPQRIDRTEWGYTPARTQRPRPTGDGATASLAISSAPHVCRENDFVARPAVQRNEKPLSSQSSHSLAAIGWDG